MSSPAPSVAAAAEDDAGAVQGFRLSDQMEDTMGRTRKFQTLLSPNTRRSSTFVVKGASNLAQDAQPQRTKVQTFHSVIRTEDHLTLEHLQTLMGVFFKHGGTLQQDQFQQALTEILGPSDRFRKQMAMLFQKMDTRGTGELDWDEFCSYMMQDLQGKEDLGNERELPLLVCPQLFVTPHHGAIRRVLLISNPARFLSASDDGTICFWNMKMACTRTITLATKQTKNMRVTDIAYMASAFRLVVATVNRDLCFYDSATAMLCNRVVGLSDVATSLDYYPDPSDSDRSWLVFGDMGGAINVLLFSSSSTQLFNPPVSAWHDGLNIHLSSIEDVPPAISSGTVVKYFRYRTHVASEDEVDKSVKLVKVIPALNAIISSASTAARSLVLRDLTTHDDGSHFSVPKGVVTFDFSERWNVIATGGADCNLRLWNPYVPTHPTALLKGHAVAICHVAFSPEYGQVISLAANEVIKIWDIKDQVCLNTLTSVIPHRPLHGRQLLSAMLWHDPTQSIITACRDELSIVQMTRDDRTRAAQTSHESPVVAVVFVAEFNRIISADVSGVITSWEVGTGHKVLQFSETHPGASLTAMCAGHAGKRLITGASDGAIKVWNTLSGALLQQLVKSRPLEVTGLLWLKDRIFTVGWDREVTSFKDNPIHSLSECPVMVHADSDWQPNATHQDDISTLDYCPEVLLATGSFDGKILIWNLRSGRMLNKFDSRTAQRADPGVTRLHHAVRATVDRVLWLRARVRDTTNTKAANFVSTSDSGMVHFWNAFKGNLMGSFHAAFADQGSQTVPCLATNAANTLLLTGDSLGYVRLWNIDDVCTGLHGSRDGKPRQLASWRAHVQGITSLVYVESSRIIVTGSADCAVRVWSSAGHFVGTFTSSSAWVLASEPTGSSFTLGIAYNPALDHPDAEESVARLSMLSMDHSSSPELDREGRPDASAALEPIDEDDGKRRVELSRSDPGLGAATTAAATAAAAAAAASLGVTASASVGALASGPGAGAGGMRLETSLSSTLQRRLEQRLDEKATWRATQSKPELARITKPGFLFCQPFQALLHSDLDQIRAPPEPAAAVRARTQRIALWDGDDERKPTTRGRRREGLAGDTGLFPPLARSRGPSRTEKR